VSWSDVNVLAVASALDGCRADLRWQRGQLDEICRARQGSPMNQLAAHATLCQDLRWGSSRLM